VVKTKETPHGVSSIHMELTNKPSGLLFQNYTANANTTNNYSVNKSSAY